VNTTVPSPTNWPEDSQKKRRASKLRAIDKGTPYDVPGRLKKWAREIEKGKMGYVTDYLLVVRAIKDGQTALEHFCGGTGTAENYLYMAQAAVMRNSPVRGAL
jgi:hypothetical protein